MALLGKHTLVLANRNLEQQCTTTETVRIKSGAWDSTAKIFIYTTVNHVKYILPNGDTGIIRTLDVPIYLTKVMDRKISGTLPPLPFTRPISHLAWLVVSDIVAGTR